MFNIYEIFKVLISFYISIFFLGLTSATTLNFWLSELSSPSGTEYFNLAYSATIKQHTLSTAWDLTTLSFDASYSSPVWYSNVSDLLFSADWLKTFYLSQTNKKVITCINSTAFVPIVSSCSDFDYSSIITATYTKFFSFNNDWTKFYLVNWDTATLYEFWLTVAYDLSTATLNWNTLAVTWLIWFNHSAFFKWDWTRLYWGDDYVVSYFDLSTAWDISTATLNWTTKTFPDKNSDMFFSNDWTIFFQYDEWDYRIRSFDLSTAWDISTAILNDTVQPTSDNNTFWIYFRNDWVAFIDNF